MRHSNGPAVLLTLAFVAVVAIRLHTAPSERVFSVTEVQRGLAAHPRQWLNHTVLVRGVFLTTMSDPGPIDVFHPPPNILVTYALYQPGPARMGGISGLPLTLKLAPHLRPPTTNPLGEMVRRIPWLQRLFGGTSTPVFRVTLLATTQGGCASQMCADGQLDEQP